MLSSWLCSLIASSSSSTSMEPRHRAPIAPRRSCICTDLFICSFGCCSCLVGHPLRLLLTSRSSVSLASLRDTVRPQHLVYTTELCGKGSLLKGRCVRCNCDTSASVWPLACSRNLYVRRTLTLLCDYVECVLFG
jgi:hypothetical protein